MRTRTHGQAGQQAGRQAGTRTRKQSGTRAQTRIRHSKPITSIHKWLQAVPCCWHGRTNRTELIEIFACVFLFNTGLIAFQPATPNGLSASICPSVRLSVRPSVRPSVCLMARANAEGALGRTHREYARRIDDERFPCSPLQPNQNPHVRLRRSRPYIRLNNGRIKNTVVKK